jgi:hypothetical protein
MPAKPHNSFTLISAQKRPPKPIKAFAASHLHELEFPEKAPYVVACIMLLFPHVSSTTRSVSVNILPLADSPGTDLPPIAKISGNGSSPAGAPIHAE